MNSPIDTNSNPNPKNFHRHCSSFWKLWQQNQDYLYHCCLSWTNGNEVDAEEAMSRATLQAWSKWLDYSETITNPKAWLTRLTHNICIDMYRESNWGGQRVDSLEEIEFIEDEIVPARAESVECAEMVAYIRRSIKALSPKLREPLILHYYQEKSCREIASQLKLSEESVWKRLQRGRTILKRQLNQYLSEAGNLTGNSLQLLHSIPLTRESDNLPTLEVSITPKSIFKPIKYRVTATCLQTLPHTWYRFPTPLEWS